MKNWNTYQDNNRSITSEDREDAEKYKMTISEKIDTFISVEGKGSIRDALNIALARIDQKQAIIEQLQKELDDADDLLWSQNTSCS
jgi:hypothetical protein